MTLTIKIHKEDIMLISQSALILALTVFINSAPLPYASSIGIIGGADGPTAVYISEDTEPVCTVYDE